MKILTKNNILGLAIALILLFISSGSLHSQWKIVEENNMRNNLFFVNANIGWAVGANGIIRNTTDGGITWVIQTSGTTNTLTDVCFCNVNTGWIVGMNGSILKTTNGGATWINQTYDVTCSYFSVYFIDNNTGWAVGANSTYNPIIIKTTDGGSSWVNQPIGLSNSLMNSMYFVDSNTGWVVGSNGIIINTTDGGLSWVSQTSGINNTLNSVYFSDVNNGWVVGNDGKILTTNNGGINWISQNSGTTNVLKSVYFADSNTGWTVGISGIILKSADGGITWESKISGTTNFLNGVHFADSNTGWVVGANGIILKTTDGGTNFISQSTGTPNLLKSLYFADLNNAWIVGMSGTILKTSDSGLSWENQTSGTTNILNGVHFADVNTGWAVGMMGTIRKTTDSGLSWENQTSGTTNILNGVHFADIYTGWAVGMSGTIRKTIDGGSTWFSQASGTTNMLNGVDFTDVYKGWTVGSLGTILNTTNSGTNWLTQTSGTTNALYGVDFLDENTGWAVGASGTILKTTDGGTTWSVQTCGTTNVLYGVVFLDANTGWAVGDKGTILNTTDGGTSWIIKSSGTGSTLNAIHFANANTGCIVGANGTIIRKTISEPQLLTPANNSKYLPLDLTLVWQNIPNTYSYTLQVSDTPDFSNLVVNESGLTSTEFQLNGLDTKTNYYWRVNASNAIDVSSWSDIWTFNTLLWNTSETNNSSTIIVPISINPMLGDRPFASGDAIGLFYQNDNNEWVCGGYGVWNGANLGITVFGDNSDTPIKEGFTIGETYTYKVWDSVLEQEWNATATYLSGESFYTIGGFSMLASLIVNIPVEQNISLNPGWNIISSYIIPENLAIPNVFQNVNSDIKIVKNGAGEMYDPAFNINTIGNWNYSDGYLVNMLNNNELTITGTKLLPEATPINLNNGWNLSAYLRDNEMSPTTALSTISPSLVLAKDNVGGIYSPVYGVNTLGNMQTGQGYYFYMNAASILTYPANSAKKAVAGDNVTPPAKYNIPTMKNTGKNATLLISIENNEGNEIGVYNMNNELIGSGAVQNGIAAITVWGDDEATQKIDGAKDNEYLNVKLYNTTNNTSKEISLTQINEITSNTEQNELFYKTNSIYFAKASANDESGFAMSIKNIPNPVTNSTIFEFSLTEESNTEIQIYTSNGELIASIGNKIYSAGLHRVSFDASNLASGMYNIVLSSGSKKVSSFMIVGK